MCYNESDGIVILNDGRIGEFRFYLYGENNASGMNGEIKNLKQLPIVLIKLLKEKGLIKKEVL